MKHSLLIFMLLASAFSQTEAWAEPELAGTANRIHYLERLLTSLRSLSFRDFQRLSTEAHAVFAGVCKSSDPSLALTCALESAAKICRGGAWQPTCLIVMDALIVERLNAKQFISARERYEMMSRSSDYREKQAQALHHRYGSLATAFSLSAAALCQSSDLACLAQKMEDFCQAKARTGQLSYQSCSAVLALYVGSPTGD